MEGVPKDQSMQHGSTTNAYRYQVYTRCLLRTSPDEFGTSMVATCSYLLTVKYSTLTWRLPALAPRVEGFCLSSSESSDSMKSEQSEGSCQQTQCSTVQELVSTQE